MNRRNALFVLGTAGVATTALSVRERGEILNSFVGYPKWDIQTSWDIEELTGKTGKSLLQALVDVDDDGERELVANVGAQSHFVCYDQDQQLVWENVQDTTQHKGAYYPKVADNALFYGDRSSNTLYCINLSDGSLRWSKSPYPGLEAIDFCDIGVVLGGDNLAILDFNDGSEKWSVGFDTHEQVVACGDIDCDGIEEVVAGNSSGTLTIRNQDGSEAFQIISGVHHYDLITIGDIDPTHSGNELLTVVDSNNSSTSNEGDELATFNEKGEKLNRYTAGDGVNFAVGDFEPEKSGLEIVFGVEGSTSIGQVDGTLTEQWTRSIKNTGSNPAGQVGAMDVDGDGVPEVYVNTGESLDAGFKVFDADGSYVGELLGHGWDIDPQPDLSTGSTKAKDYQGTPDSEGVLLKPSRLKSNNYADREVIQLIRLSK